VLSWVFVMFNDRRRASRQHDPEDRPAVRTAFDGDVAAVHLDGPSCDGESESGAAVVARPAFIEAKEAIEDPLAVFRGAIPGPWSATARMASPPSAWTRMSMVDA
jgi:hypothetical protein